MVDVSHFISHFISLGRRCKITICNNISFKDFFKENIDFRISAISNAMNYH